MGSKKCVIKTRCDYHSCHRLTLCGTINHQQFHCSHSTLHGRDSRWYISKILVGKEVKELRKKGALIKRSFSVCVCLKYDWANTSEDLETLWVADITTDHRAAYNVGFWLLGTSSEDIQRSWKLEIQSMSEKKKNPVQEPSRFELSV